MSWGRADRRPRVPAARPPARIVVHRGGPTRRAGHGRRIEGGPENVLIRVSPDTAEYWDSPGSKVTQVANLLKAKVTGERYEGDNRTVGL